jgi:hypothetical protein
MTKNGEQKTKRTTTKREPPATTIDLARMRDEALCERVFAAGADAVFIGDPLGRGVVYSREAFATRRGSPRREART